MSRQDTTTTTTPAAITSPANTGEDQVTQDAAAPTAFPFAPLPPYMPGRPSAAVLGLAWAGPSASEASIEPMPLLESAPAPTSAPPPTSAIISPSGLLTPPPSPRLPPSIPAAPVHPSQSASSPPQASNWSPASPSRPEDHCFHRIKAWVRGNAPAAGTPEPVGTCPICYGELNIHGITPAGPASGRKDGVALQCTHMLCVECHEKVCRETGGPVGCCLLCREKIVAMVRGRKAGLD
ncbi:hypothetical protein B0T14DRAFT_495155 [Immersiella caudata]|uniref:RING-type domain-containing protein n=1 Tax=Immersiella caudata TaxID=314043 RepID=A0AA40C388_9PEZI|nr:hypothetical protein B0T14DRAFT_495155 [Immersiella caudata]